MTVTTLYLLHALAGVADAEVEGSLAALQHVQADVSPPRLHPAARQHHRLPGLHAAGSLIGWWVRYIPIELLGLVGGCGIFLLSYLDWSVGAVHIQ